MPSPARPGPLGLDSNSHGIDYGTLMRVLTPVPTLLPQAPQTVESAAKPQSTYSIDAAVKHLNAHAHPKSIGKCGRYTREAIQAGGAKFPSTTKYAKDYGPILQKIGFVKIAAHDYAPKKGDVVVLQPPAGKTEGHMQMFNGTAWVSDFVQGTDIYPGPAYRKEKVSYEIFRPE